MKQKMFFSILLTCSLLFNVAQFVYGGWKNYPEGIKEAVPNEEAALKVAEAVLSSVYGEYIIHEGPYNVEYSSIKNEWLVYGTLPEGYVGGVPEIAIRKSDGKVTMIYHGM